MNLCSVEASWRSRAYAMSISVICVGKSQRKMQTSSGQHTNNVEPVGAQQQNTDEGE